MENRTGGASAAEAGEGLTAISQKQFVLQALEQHERTLTAYAMRLLQGDLHTAHDAVQHTFMKLCTQSPEELRHRLAPWLFSVCRNKILDDAKSQRRKSSVPPEFDSVDFGAIDPAHKFEREELLQNVRLLIDRLPASEREVVELWSHGLGATEIGEVMNKKPGTIRVTLHRGLEQLRRNPSISIWLERATGQIVQPDDEASSKATPSKCDENSKPIPTGERR